MVDYKKGSHTIYDIKYHVVWVTKYRYKILTKVIGERLRELIRQGCETIEVTIVQGSIGKDHVHMLLSCPTNISPSKRVQYLKGRSSKLLQDEFPEIKKRYWGQHLCSRVFLCNSGVGNGRNNQSIYCKSGQKRYNRNIYN